MPLPGGRVRHRDGMASLALRPEVMKHFVPLMRRGAPWRTARVFRFAASEPASPAR